MLTAYFSTPRRQDAKRFYGLNHKDAKITKGFMGFKHEDHEDHEDHEGYEGFCCLKHRELRDHRELLCS